MENLQTDQNLVDTRMSFANSLHYNGHYELALEITRSVLAEHPKRLDAMTLEADLLDHLERVADAEKRIREVLELDDSFEDAWHVLKNIHLRRGNGQELLSAVRRLVALGYPEKYLLEDEGIALVQLKDEPALRDCLERIRAANLARSSEKASILACLFYVKCGRFEKAHALAESTLSRNSHGQETLFHRQLSVCRALALLGLGRGHEVSPLRTESLHWFGRTGFSQWVSDLHAAGLVKT